MIEICITLVSFIALVMPLVGQGADEEAVTNVPSNLNRSRTGPADLARDSPVAVSTNDLVRILHGETNVAYAAFAERIFHSYTVFLNPKGHLKARYDVVSAFSTEYELVSKLAECLAGASVSMRKQPDGSFLHINKSKERFSIHIIHDECDSSHFQGVYYVVADRGLVTIDAVLHLETRPDRDGTINYALHIYADSNSWILNLFSRIPFVEHYLTHEVHDVVTKFDVMYAKMLRDPPRNLQKVMKFRDPKGNIYFSDRDLELINKFLNDVLGNQSTAHAQ